VSGPPAALLARGLTKRFGARRALEGLDWSVRTGESWAIFGPNGAGKSTLLRIAAGALRPDAGTLTLGGLDPRRDAAARAGLGWIAHAAMLYDDLTALENLVFFARLHGVHRARDRAMELLTRFELDHRAEDHVGTLSRGLKQRVALARALVHDPVLMLLDEPFSGLDPRASLLLRDVLGQLRSAGRTLVIVTHDVAEGLRLSDRWIALRGGRLSEDGDSARTDADALNRRMGAAPARAARVHA
jgi:heme exporter protein A